MSEYKLKKSKPKRIIAAALLTAVSVLGGAWLHAINSESAALIWLTTAVYMLGPILAALLVWPLLVDEGWLFMTAVLLSLAVVVPWAFVKPSVWATTYLPQLGLWANVLFIVLLMTQVGAGRPSKLISWSLTGFYLLIMLTMPLVL